MITYIKNLRYVKDCYSNFLIELAGHIATVPEQYIKALGLYIVLSYGDPDKHRIIPFDLAGLVSLFSQEVAALTLQAKKKTEEERQAFQAKFIAEEEQTRAACRRDERSNKIKARQKATESSISSIIWRHINTTRSGRTNRYENSTENDLWYPANVYTWFIWLSSYRNIEMLILPYKTAKFSQFWKFLLSERQVSAIDKISKGLTWERTYGIGSELYMRYMRPRVTNYLKRFLYRYQEGALMIIALLDCAGRGGPGFSKFSDIEGKDLVEMWCFLEKLRCLMCGEIDGRIFSYLFANYFERKSFYGYSFAEYDELLDYAGFPTSISRTPIYDYIKKREDVQSLVKLLTQRWDWFAKRCPPAAKLWNKIDTPVRYYFFCAARLIW